MRLFKNKHATGTDDRPRMRPLTQQQPRQSNIVFSYHAVRSAAVPDEARQPGESREPVPKRLSHRALRRLRTARASAVLALFVMLVLVSLQLTSHPKIVSLGSGRIFLRPSAAYEQAAQKVLQESWLNHNKITVNTAHIETALQQQFPEIENISVSLPLLGNQPIIYMQPAVPQLILATTGGARYVLDDKGRALINASAASDLAELHLPVVTDQSGLQVSPGRIALPTSDVAFISQVAAQLAAQKITLTSMTLPAGTSELDVRTAGAGYFVKYNLKGDARAEAGTFAAVKGYLGAKHITPGQYIDVRVPDRAYYK